MLLAKQDEARINLDEEQDDFLLANIPEDEELQELNALCIMMARIQMVANDSDVEPSYDLDLMDEVHDCSSSFLEGLFLKNNHEQNEGVNSDNVEQDNNAHDSQCAELESLLRNAQIELAKSQKVSLEVKKANALLTKELETYKELALNREKKLEDQIQTQFLVKKRKNEAFENEKHDLTIQSSIQINNILLLRQERKSLKENFKKQEDKYLDDILRLEVKP
ncbi:hypothetical protein Tco_0882839 [Tanacetum coccineum]